MEKLIELLKSGRMREFTDRYGSQLKKLALLGILVIIVFAGFLHKADEDEPVLKDSGVSETTEQAAQSEQDGRAAADIYVDIGGAVSTPMLAKLPEGSRVEDAIQAAGGLTENADVSAINRAEFLNDGDKIYIPEFIEDEDGNAVPAAETSAGTASSDAGSSDAGSSVRVATDGKVNINTADSTQLQTLNGVGPATAQKIIDYRTMNGRFTSIEDIKNVSGIGDKTFEKLKDCITT